MTKNWLYCDNNQTIQGCALCLKTEDEDGCDYCKREECAETMILGELDDEY